MAEGFEAIDVEAGMSLDDVAELLSSTRESRLLRRQGKIVAMLMPFGMKTMKTNAGREAFERAAGSWDAIDTDRFLKANRRSRDLSTRPAANL
jgi:hypothetical protein